MVLQSALALSILGRPEDLIQEERGIARTAILAVRRVSFQLALITPGTRVDHPAVVR